MNPFLKIEIPWLKKIALAVAFCSVAWQTPISAQTTNANVPHIDGISDHAAAQIGALMAEKAVRTPAQQKIDSQLLFEQKNQRGEEIAPGVRNLRTDLRHAKNDPSRVMVEIDGDITPQLIEKIKSLGGEIQGAFPKFHVVVAYLGLEQLETVAADPAVRFIAAVHPPRTQTGNVDSEGDRAMAADTARTYFPVDATGLKIGVLSDSASAAAINRSGNNGEFTPGEVTVLPGQDATGLGEDEGVAMMEIISDICPGAQLYFATGNPNEAQFAQNIRDLRNVYHCDIIVDDLLYPSEPPFQDGQIAQAVNDVTADGAMYFSSASNSGNKTSGTSGTWVGDFQDGGAYSVTVGQTTTNYRIHQFQSSPAQNYDVISSIRASDYVALHWADPLGASSNDYDIFIVDSAGTTLLGGSNTNQTGTQNPYEYAGTGWAANDRILICKKVGDASRALYLTTSRGTLSINTDGFAIGHATAEKAISVAAVPAAAAQQYSDTHQPIPGAPTGPYPNTYTNTQKQELFSSDGPAHKFYKADGSAITSNNFLFATGGGSTLQYPVMTASDGVNTSVPGFQPFFGTSAAAPHAAAVAGLIKAYKPSLTSAQIRDIMVNTALDILAPGQDRDSGAGIVQPLAALNSIAERPVVAILHPGNHSDVNTLDTISGTASDPNGLPLENNQVNLNLYHVSTGQYWNGLAWTSTQSVITAPVADDGTWTKSSGLPTGSNLRTGLYTLSAFVKNSAGLVSQAQSGVTSISFSVDGGPPTVSISSPVDGSIITGPTYSFTGTAHDDQSVSSVNLFIRRDSDSLYWNGSSWVADAGAAVLESNYTDGSPNWSCTSPLPYPGGALNNGSYHFIAIANDGAGNHTQVDSVVTVNYHPQWTWTHGSVNDSDPNNDNNRWDNPANWSPYGVPPAEAYINIGGDTVDVSYMSELTLYGLDIGNGGGIHAAQLNIPAGSTMNWSGGSFSGTLNILSGATANFFGADKLLGTNSVVNNHGTVVWSATGVIQGYQDTTFNNFADGLLKLSADGPVFANYYGGNVLNNFGTIRKTSGDSSSVFFHWTYNNSGTIAADTGTISFTEGVNFANNSHFVGPARILLASGTASVAGTMKVDGVLLQFGGANVSGTASYVSTNNGSVLWTSGQVNGAMTVSNGASLLINGGGSKLLGQGAFLYNYGNVELADNGPLQGYQNSTIHNYAGSLFALSGNAPLINYYGGNAIIVDGGSSFLKTGTFEGTTQIDWSFSSSGLVAVSQGTLDLNGGGASSGDFDLSAATTLRFLPGATQTLSDGAFFSGTGTMQIVGGTVTASGAVHAGTVAAPFVCEISSGRLTTTGSGVFSAYGTTNWTGGAIGGDFRVPVGSTLNLSSAGVKQIDGAGVITNAGTINWTGPGLLLGYQNSIVNNLAGATFNINGDGQVFVNYYGGNVFNNAGTLAKTSGSMANILTDWTFNNSGTISVTTGVLEYDSTLNLNAGTTLTGAGLVRLAGTINTAEGVSLGNNIELAGGTINSANPANPSLVTGTLNWTTGTLNGTWNIASGATFNITGDATKLMGGGAVLNNSGTINWTGSGSLQGYQNVSINNSGNFNANSDAVLLNYYTGNTFNNAAAGHFTKASGTGTSRTEWDMNNAGTITVSTGRLELDGSGSSSGAFVTATNSVIAWASGTPGLTNGSVIQGPGKFQLSGGTLTVSGSVVAGTIPAHTTFELMSPAILASGPSGSYLAVYGLFNWSGGTLSQVVIPYGSDMNVFGMDGKQISQDGSISNNGTITWLGDGQIQGFQDSTIVNNAGASFVIQADGTPLINYHTGNVFINQGTLIKNGGNGETALSQWRFDNNGGTLNVRSGTLAFSSELHLNDGGQFTGPSVGTPTYLASNGQTHMNGTTTTNNVVFALTGDHIFGESNGVINASGMGQFQWLGGTISGTLGLAANCPSFIAGVDGKTLDAGAILNNAGNLTLKSVSTLTGYQNSHLNNLAGANLTIERGATLTHVYGGSALTNNGTLVVSLAPGVSNFDGWDFVQTASGTLDMRLVSLETYDALHFNGGTATFDGTLNVSLLNNYLPNVGDGFPLITYTSSSGQFANIHTPGFLFNPGYNADNFWIVGTQLATLPQWQAGYFGDPNSPQAADTASPAGDGVANLLKYALGLNPTLPFTSPIGLTGVGEGSGGSLSRTDSTQANNNHPTFSFRRIDPVNVTYVVQASENLTNANGWTEIARLNTGASSWSGSATVDETGTGSLRAVTVTDSITFAQKPRRYYRLVVSH